MHISNVAIDIDECSDNTHACSQVCVNDLGTYHCDCFTGYENITTTPIDVNCTGKYCNYVIQQCCMLSFIISIHILYKDSIITYGCMALLQI